MTETDAKPDATETNDEGEWAIVEIFGHRRHAGRAREEERFGAKMLRIDVPTIAEPAAGGEASTDEEVIDWVTHWYGGASIFSFTLTDEATVLRMNRASSPPQRYLPPAEEDSADDFFETF